jgi:hypothetical protein
VGFLGVFKGVH